MLIYWIMFAVPAAFALLEKPVKPGQARLGFAWLMAFAALVTIIGLRWETGGDWGNYERMVENAYWDIDQFGLLGDPAFTWLTTLAARSSYGMLLLTMTSAVVMAFTLIRFCLAQPRPWLCLAVAVPYFVVVMGMGYIRQGMAVSLLLMAFASLKHIGPVRFSLWVLAAASFHSTALIMLPLAAFISQAHPYRQLLALIFALAVVATSASSLRAGLLVTNYVDEEMTSSGALVRLVMTALPAAVLLGWRKRFMLVGSEVPIWTILALAGIAALALVLIFPTSTAIDRLGLYLLPLQCFVYARLPEALSGNDRTARVLAVGVVALYAAAFFVWLNYAVNVSYWLPYRFFPLEDGVCLEC